jgi:phosphinothricin acetyltransferase
MPAILPGAIRPFQTADLPALQRIYAQAIAAGFCTADLEPPSQARWQAFVETHRDPRYPAWVFAQGEQIMGYAALTPHRPGRRGLARTAELSFYVDFRFHGKGIGSLLVEHALQESKRLGHHALFGLLLEANEPSRRLLSQHGFAVWGRLPEVFRYAENWHDQLYLGRLLEEPEKGI